MPPRIAPFANVVRAATLAGILLAGSYAVAQDNLTPSTATAIENAKSLHQKANEKDPEAMYALAMLVIAEAPATQAEYDASEWPRYGGRYVFGRHALLQEAARLGSKDAAAYLCKVASDPGAPARYRSNKDTWCSAQ